MPQMAGCSPRLPARAQRQATRANHAGCSHPEPVTLLPDQHPQAGAEGSPQEHAGHEEGIDAPPASGLRPQMRC
jgi:hypothetical protein